MFWLLAAILALYLALTVISIRVDFRHSDTTQGRLLVQAAGLHKSWRFSLIRTAKGHRIVLAGTHGPEPLDTAQFRQSRGGLMLQALRRGDKGRKFLLRHTHLDRMDALIQLRTEDAARAALLTGTARSVLCCIPAIRRRNIRIRVLPEFFRSHSTVAARCIIRVKGGTLLLTAGLLLLSYRKEQRLRESEAV